MDFDTMTLSDGPVATVTLRRPRIDVAFLRDLERVCNHLDDVSAAKVLVFRADGPDFCGGIDFGAFHPDTPIDIHGFAKWEKLVTRVERLKKATIAALHGRVEGGGLHLALACDRRVAAPGTTLALPEVPQGFLPGMAVFRLAKYVGLGRAKRMILTGEVVAAEDLPELVDRVGELEAEIASSIALFGPVHPVALEMARRLLLESFADSHEDAVGHFLAAQARCVAEPAFVATLAKSRG